MWVFTTIGMFSVVQDRNRPGNLLVRARDRRHLMLLKKRTGIDEPIHHTPEADYLCRMSVSKTDWHEAIDMLTRDIDYDNFKAAVPCCPYEQKLHQVWATYKYGDHNED